MIRLLPFILIPILLVGVLGWWRYSASKQSLTTPQTIIADLAPVEVPKTLPNATIDDRVKALEDLLTKVVTSVNALKSQSSSTQSSTTLDSRLSAVEGALTELKARVSTLEKTSAPATSGSQSTVYIPLGSGGGPWANTNWYSTPEYEISLDPANYPGYSGMSLEVTFRLTENAGTGSVRLYNVTDSSATSGQLDTTSTTFALKSTSSFKLPSGTKTYRLQVQSTSEKNLFIQSARIKVSF